MTRTKDAPILDDYYLVLSTKLYEWFLKHDRCGEEEHPRSLREDAFRLYQHYLYIAVKQKTASVWATLEYVAKGCAMGLARAKRARAFLVDHALIHYRQEVHSGGDRGLRSGRVYTVIALRPSISGGTKTDPPEDQAKNGTFDSGGTAVGPAVTRPGREPTPEVLEESTEVLQEEREYIAGSPPADEDSPPSGSSNGGGNGGNGKPRRKGKHSSEDVALFQEVADLIRYGTTDHAEAVRRKECGEPRGPAWAGVKDSEAVYRGIRFARSQHPAQAREYLIELVEGAWELHEGRVAGMSDFDKRRWADVAFTPCKLDWQQIDATLTRLAPAKDDTLSFEEMERLGYGKPWGPKPWER